MYVNNKERTALLIDIAIPIDDCIVDERIEKVEKYQYLAIELKALWQLKEIAIVPNVVGRTGVVGKKLTNYIGKINIFEIQKINFLDSASTMKILKMN